MSNYQLSVIYCLVLALVLAWAFLDQGNRHD